MQIDVIFKVITIPKLGILNFYSIFLLNTSFTIFFSSLKINDSTRKEILVHVANNYYYIITWFCFQHSIHYGMSVDVFKWRDVRNVWILPKLRVSMQVSNFKLIGLNNCDSIWVFPKDVFRSRYFFSHRYEMFIKITNENYPDLLATWTKEAKVYMCTML